MSAPPEILDQGDYESTFYDGSGFLKIHSVGSLIHPCLRYKNDIESILHGQVLVNSSSSSSDVNNDFTSYSKRESKGQQLVISNSQRLVLVPYMNVILVSKWDDIEQRAREMESLLTKGEEAQLKINEEMEEFLIHCVLVLPECNSIRFSSLVLSPDESYLIAVGDVAEDIFLYDITHLAEKETRKPLWFHSSPLSSANVVDAATTKPIISISSKNHVLIVVGKQCFVLNAQSGTLIKKFEFNIKAICWSPNGNHLLVQTSNNDLQIISPHEANIETETRMLNHMMENSITPNIISLDWKKVDSLKGEREVIAVAFQGKSKKLAKISLRLWEFDPNNYDVFSPIYEFPNPLTNSDECDKSWKYQLHIQYYQPWNMFILTSTWDQGVCMIGRSDETEDDSFPLWFKFSVLDPKANPNHNPQVFKTTQYGLSDGCWWPNQDKQNNIGEIDMSEYPLSSCLSLCSTKSIPAKLISEQSEDEEDKAPAPALLFATTDGILRLVSITDFTKTTETPNALITADIQPVSRDQQSSYSSMPIKITLPIVSDTLETQIPQVNGAPTSVLDITQPPSEPTPNPEPVSNPVATTTFNPTSTSTFTFTTKSPFNPTEISTPNTNPSLVFNRESGFSTPWLTDSQSFNITNNQQKPIDVTQPAQMQPVTSATVAPQVNRNEFIQQTPLAQASSHKYPALAVNNSEDVGDQYDNASSEMKSRKDKTPQPIAMSAIPNTTEEQKQDSSSKPVVIECYVETTVQWPKELLEKIDYSDYPSTNSSGSNPLDKSLLAVLSLFKERSMKLEEATDACAKEMGEPSDFRRNTKKIIDDTEAAQNGDLGRAKEEFEELKNRAQELSDVAVYMESNLKSEIQKDLDVLTDSKKRAELYQECVRELDDQLLAMKTRFHDINDRSMLIQREIDARRRLLDGQTAFELELARKPVEFANTLFMDASKLNERSHRIAKEIERIEKALKIEEKSNAKNNKVSDALIPTTSSTVLAENVAFKVHKNQNEANSKAVFADIQKFFTNTRSSDDIPVFDISGKPINQGHDAPKTGKYGSSLASSSKIAATASSQSIPQPSSSLANIGPISDLPRKGDLKLTGLDGVEVRNFVPSAPTTAPTFKLQQSQPKPPADAPAPSSAAAVSIPAPSTNLSSLGLSKSAGNSGISSLDKSSMMAALNDPKPASNVPTTSFALTAANSVPSNPSIQPTSSTAPSMFGASQITAPSTPNPPSNQPTNPSQPSNLTSPIFGNTNATPAANTFQPTQSNPSGANPQPSTFGMPGPATAQSFQASSFGAVGNTQKGGNDFRSQLVNFYQKVAPDNVQKVDTIIQKYGGNEAELVRKLRDKYPTADYSMFGNLANSNPAQPSGMMGMNPAGTSTMGMNLGNQGGFSAYAQKGQQAQGFGAFSGQASGFATMSQMAPQSNLPSFNNPSFTMMRR